MDDVVVYTKEIEDFIEYLKEILIEYRNSDDKDIVKELENKFSKREIKKWIEERESLITLQVEEIVDTIIFNSIRLREIMLTEDKVSLEDINIVNLIKNWLRRTFRSDVIAMLRKTNIFCIDATSTSTSTNTNEFLLRLVVNNIYSYFNK